MFITFEGPDGSGKTTQMNLLMPVLSAQYPEVIRTREPGGTPIGDQIRSVIMNMKNKSMHPRTEILLFCASRAQLKSSRSVNLLPPWVVHIHRPSTHLASMATTTNWLP